MANFKESVFLGGMPPDPPSISIRRMLIVLRTMEHTCIYRCPRYPYAFLPGG